MLVYGGTGVPFGESASNDLHVCNLETLEWSQIETDGCPPIRSYGHVSTAITSENFLCGLNWICPNHKLLCQLCVQITELESLYLSLFYTSDYSQLIKTYSRT